MYIDRHGRKFFKGNLHTHTKLSDGKLSPEEAIDLYSQHGYDFIAITDHWKWYKDSSDKMLVLQGAEYAIGQSTAEGIYHIVAVGCENEPKIERDFTAQQMIDSIKEKDGIAILAHPAWSLNSPDDLAKLSGVDMTEIFNSISDLPFNCRPYSGIITDTMAARGTFWRLNAADDAHFYTKTDTCRSFIYLEAEECTEKAVMESLREGRFYASQGPTLEAEIRDGVLYVETSPVNEIVYFTNRVYTPDRATVGEGLTRGEYTLKPADTFVRVEIKDKDGNYAWSQYFTVC